jgi:hypothetical protein
MGLGDGFQQIRQNVSTPSTGHGFRDYMAPGYTPGQRIFGTIATTVGGLAGPLGSMGARWLANWWDNKHNPATQGPQMSGNTPPQSGGAGTFLGDSHGTMNYGQQGSWGNFGNNAGSFGSGNAFGNWGNGQMTNAFGGSNGGYLGGSSDPFSQGYNPNMQAGGNPFSPNSSYGGGPQQQGGGFGQAGGYASRFGSIGGGGARANFTGAGGYVSPESIAATDAAIQAGRTGSGHASGTNAAANMLGGGQFQSF